MRCAVVALVSLALSSVVISNTYYRKKQFYPTVIYITNHQPCITILLFQSVVILFFLIKAITYVLFGRLQRAEVDNLVPQSWYAFFDMCLVFTFFQDELGTEFLFLFFILLFVRCLHWLLEERVDHMERTPVLSALFHLRILLLITVMALVDAYFIRTAYWKPMDGSHSIHVALGVEYVILLINLFSTLLRYVLHSIDCMREHTWDRKTTYLLYVDIAVVFIRLTVYVDFTYVIWRRHPFPLFLARPIYLCVRSLKKAVQDVLMSRRAIRYMNTVIRDATADDLAASSDTVCIICREEMHINLDNPQSASTTVVKRLPCTHIFHATCLRSWFQRQQTCPICRMNIISQARQQEALRRQPQQSGAAPNRGGNTTPVANTNSNAGNNQSSTTAPSNNQNPSWMPPNGYPMYAPFWFPPIPNVNENTNSNASQPSTYPPFMMPPFTGMPIIFPGNLFPTSLPQMPEPPGSLPKSTLEANSKPDSVARIGSLQQISLLLNVAVLQMNAYMNGLGLPTTTPAMNANTTTTDILAQEKSANKLSVVGEMNVKKNVIISTSENEELANIRQRRLEHFKNSSNSEKESHTS